MKSSRKQSFADLLPIVLLLWVYIFLRWHDIAAHHPYFIDEIHHMRRARAVWTLSDLHTMTTPGKFLLYYWLGAFQLPVYPPLWLVRTGASMLTLLGAAGTYAFTRTLFGKRAAWVALALLAVFPFVLFYERMALTDTLAGSFAVIMAWWSVIVARRPSLHNATWLGVWVCVMLAAKILTFPMLLIPFMAVALLGPHPIQLGVSLKSEIQRIGREYQPAIRRATWIISGVWVPIVVFFQLRKFIDPNTKAIVDDYLYGAALDPNQNQYVKNLERVGQALWYLWGPLLIGLAVVALGVIFWRRWRWGVFFVGSILPLWAFVFVVAGQLNSRYLTVVAHLVVALIAGGLIMAGDVLQQRLRWRRVAWLPVGMLGIWGLVFALPFAYTNITAPTSLALPDRDKSEYFRNYTGYALPDALAYLAAAEPISQGSDVPVVVTFVRVCEFLPYHMPTTMHDDLRLICKPSTEQGSFSNRYDMLNTALAEYGAVYLMAEEYETSDGSPMFDPALANGTAHFLTRYERPFDGVPVLVYRMEAN
ncbi:MAG: glycosyltransferase family 39 protein [Anaerolineales bacterium]|nr:glycosyltransferase family 39 protein [Anaerolineales bacterium]